MRACQVENGFRDRFSSFFPHERAHYLLLETGCSKTVEKVCFGGKNICDLPLKLVMICVGLKAMKYIVILKS